MVEFAVLGSCNRLQLVSTSDQWQHLLANILLPIVSQTGFEEALCLCHFLHQLKQPFVQQLPAAANVALENSMCKKVLNEERVN